MAASLSLHLSALPSAATIVPFVVKAKSGNQLATILFSNPLLLGSDTAAATKQLKLWRLYVAKKCAPSGGQPQLQSLESLRTMLLSLPDHTDWLATAGAIAPFLTGSLPTRQHILEANSKPELAASLNQALIDSKDMSADLAVVRSVIEPLGSAVSIVLPVCPPYPLSPAAHGLPALRGCSCVLPQLSVKLPQGAFARV